MLCRIFLKKRIAKSDEEMVQKLKNDTNCMPVFYDFLTRDRNGDDHPCPANIGSSISSGSSGITEVSISNTESEEHEESSSCNSFSSFRRKP